MFGDPVSTYTWEQGLEDGVLVRAPEQICREAGYGLPVLLTANLSDRLEVPEEWQTYESFTGRLWDVLFVGRRAIKRSPTGANPLPFDVAVTSNLTHRRELLSLLIGFAGAAVVISLPSDD